MTRAALPSYERREQTYNDELDRAKTVADADALVYCPECATSHPATRTDDGYAVDCPTQ